ncbi:phage Gp37/Gp68 family protein, partial [Patescibacteria group bacterium]|nr:phage Gp37/Gp68 family protein [Patescibacteria group bacterium]
TGDPRGSRFEGRQDGEPEGRTKSRLQIDRCPSCGDSETQIVGRETLLDSGGFRRYVSDDLANCTTDSPLISWVVCGGEIGPNARPCYVDWIRSIIGQCQDAGVPCWVKQLGHRAIGQVIPGLSSLPMPDLVADRWLLDRNGADPAEWPPDLKVFEMGE